MAFVVNAATPRARISAEVAIALSQHGTVSPVTIHQRTDFAASMIDGRTVMELPASRRAAREIADLWDYLVDRLGRLEPKHGKRTVLAGSGAAGERGSGDSGHPVKKPGDGMMKAARLEGDLLMRKGTAAPVPCVEVLHSDPDSRALPSATAVGHGVVQRQPGPDETQPGGREGAGLKRDRFGRVRVSLRLDPHRHLRLRLLAAHSRMSQQQTLIAALDAYLDASFNSSLDGGAPGARDGNGDRQHQAAGEREPAPGLAPGVGP